MDSVKDQISALLCGFYEVIPVVRGQWQPPVEALIGCPTTLAVTRGCI